MEAAGQQRIVRAEDVAHMGLTEVLRHALYIHSQYRALVSAIKRDPPSLAILIDFPDVNFRLAKHLRRLGVPVLWFVSPQLWAWKRRRLRWVRKRVSKMLVIFPFEEPFYRNRGVDATFVGHPLATLPPPTISREKYAKNASALHQDQWNCAEQAMQSNPLPDWAFYKSMQGIRYELDTSKQWIALLPGSRASEVRANLWGMVEMAILLGNQYEYLVPVAPTIGQETLDTMQAETGEQLDGPEPPRITFVRDARAALHFSRASIVASGTATVQALTVGNPFIVVYRVSPLTYAILKRLIRYPAEVPAQPGADGNLPIAMPNLIAGRRIVPELLNHRFTAANLAAALRPLLEDSPARGEMIADLAEARARLLPAPDSNPIQRVCDAAQDLLQSAPARIAQNPLRNV